MEQPIFSVAIPAHDDRRRLARTLESIGRSNFDPDRLEVVVADDSSSDGTYDALKNRHFPFRFRIRRGSWGSQSAATNEAIRHCTGRYILLSAQDIVFHEDLIAQHLAWHRKYPDEEVAVLGYLPYPSDMQLNPFSYYLVNGGFQFAYFLIKDPLRVPPNFVYAPNLSLRRSTLERIGEFDEQFPYGYQDTDLGIRLDQGGVRIVYNEQAVGYHDHPNDLETFCRRQEKVAPGRIRIQAKHPIYEGGYFCWDEVIRYFFGSSMARRDLDRRLIEAHEASLAERSDYTDLWFRTAIRGEELDSFTDEQRQTVRITENLFGAYSRVLQFHWCKAYFQAACEQFGHEEVSTIVHSRLSRMQASLQGHRLVQQQLQACGLRPWPVATDDCVSSRIVHGIRSFEDALGLLDLYHPPNARALNQELIFVAPQGLLSSVEIAIIEESALLFQSATPGEGIGAAILAARSELILCTDVRFQVDVTRTVAVAQRVFERFPGVAMLGGGIEEPSRETIRYGFQCRENRAVGPPLERPLRGPGEPIPVDATIPEFLVLRRERGLPSLDGFSRSDDWHLDLAWQLRQSGAIILHLPDFRGSSISAGASSRRAGKHDSRRPDAATVFAS